MKTVTIENIAPEAMFKFSKDVAQYLMLQCQGCGSA
jgi:hypothetical protein